jgi:predicted ATPase
MLQRIHLDRLDRAKTVVSLRGDERGGPKGINLASMGKGFSQVLPILTGVLGGNFDDCVLIEQPELHLHPRLQAELGDLFVDQLMHGWIHQFIIETHSEHLLLRIRRRVAEREIPAEMVGVLVVEREGSKTNVTPLSMKPDGYFDNWPKGFFEEGVKEAYALASAKGAGE